MVSVVSPASCALRTTLSVVCDVAESKTSTDDFGLNRMMCGTTYFVMIELVMHAFGEKKLTHSRSDERDGTGPSAPLKSNIGGINTADKKCNPVHSFLSESRSHVWTIEHGESS